MRKKKILFFSRDPGGANAVIPVIRKAEESFTALVYGKDSALDRYRSAGISYREWPEGNEPEEKWTKGQIRRLLLREAPDYIITGTSADDRTEKLLWSAGKEMGIPSLAILDQWINYGIRFSKYSVAEAEEYSREKSHEFLPARILVMDAYAKERMAEEGIAEDLIIPIGQPYFDLVAGEFLAIDGEQTEQYRSGLGKKEGELLFVFASEPVCRMYNGGEEAERYWGYTEETIFTALLEELEKQCRSCGREALLVIRPHPKEERCFWEKRLERHRGRVRLKIDDFTDSKRIIKAADAICGMSSMFLIEAAICGTDILSIQIGLRREDACILSKKGLIRTVFTREDLDKELARILCGRGRRVKWDVPLGTAEKILRNLDTIIKEGKAEDSHEPVSNSRREKGQGGAVSGL